MWCSAACRRVLIPAYAWPGVPATRTPAGAAAPEADRADGVRARPGARVARDRAGSRCSQRRQAHRNGVHLLAPGGEVGPGVGVLAERSAQAIQCRARAVAIMAFPSHLIRRKIRRTAC